MWIFLFAFLVFWVVLFYRTLFWAWLSSLAVLFGSWYLIGIEAKLFFGLAFLIAVSITVFLSFPPLRKKFLSPKIMQTMKKMLPSLGDTEKVALEAGTVWWDGDLFSGKPDFEKLLRFPIRELTKEEKDFLAGPVEEVCKMIHDWEVTRNGDLSPEVWKFLKEKKFLGMIIPKKYGGLEFSAQAHSAVIAKLGSRSIAAAVTVMVPNSLGPAELLMHYGTEDQKNHYLPRLASGLEIPTFALTEPHAGSDAANGESFGIVCKGTFEGKEVLGMRLNWNKRYATLGPIATVIGLAFRLLDPEHLLGKSEDLGITCALIPSHLPGISIGKRHNPLNTAFHNGPNFGKDVFVPLDFIIGGPSMAGQGWRMLMETLAAGRSISLPAMSTGLTQLTTRTVSAYGVVRKQFRLSIGKFEGVEEKIAEIVGISYLMNAARKVTAGAVDAGEKPSVVSAMMKAYTTEMMRIALNHGMDIQAGAAISLGPRNILGNAYQAIPISITVEGANILTRTMIIFGQGAIRCHPFVQEEIRAIETDDLDRFDRAFFSHLAFVARNKIRAFLMSLTTPKLSFVRVGAGPQNEIAQGVSHLSASFAYLTDTSMALLGSDLKRKEKLSGRLADAVSWLYLATALVKNFVDEGRPEKMKPIFLWAGRYALSKSESAMTELIANFPNPWIAKGLKWVLFPLGRRYKMPGDRLGSVISRLVQADSDVRNQLTQCVYVPSEKELGLGALEEAFRLSLQAQVLEDRVRAAMKDGTIAKMSLAKAVLHAVEIGILSNDDISLFEKAEKARRSVVEVDAFNPEDLSSSEHGKGPLQTSSSL